MTHCKKDDFSSDDDVIVSSDDQKSYKNPTMKQTSNHDVKQTRSEDNDKEFKSAFKSTKKNSANILGSASITGAFANSKSAPDNRLLHSSSIEMSHPFITSALATNCNPQLQDKYISQFLPNQVSTSSVNALIQQVRKPLKFEMLLMEQYYNH